jgi:hypothetical protein
MAACAFLPQMLPTSVPQLTQADAEAAEYPPLVRHLQDYQQLASKWCNRLPADATGGASLEAFLWALAVRPRDVWHLLKPLQIDGCWIANDRMTTQTIADDGRKCCRW